MQKYAVGDLGIKFHSNKLVGISTDVHCYNLTWFHLKANLQQGNLFMPKGILDMGYVKIERYICTVVHENDSRYCRVNLMTKVLHYHSFLTSKKIWVRNEYSKWNMIIILLVYSSVSEIC